MSMNFFKDRELARRMRDGLVPSKERFRYGLILFLLTTCAGATFLYDDVQTFTMWDRATDGVEIFMTLFGTIFVYKTNVRGDDKEFLERYICLGFPVLVRTTVLVAIIAALGGGLMSLIEPDQAIAWAETTSPGKIEFVLAAFGSFYFFWRLNGSMRIASTAEDDA